MTDRSVIKMEASMAPRSAEQFEKMRSDSKERIAEAAMRLFAQNGYADTTIEAIATASGVAKGLVYNYFENKEELLFYVFTGAFEHVEERFSSMVPSEHPMETVELFINGMFDFVKEHTDFWRLQMNIMMQPTVPSRCREMVMGKLREYIALFAGIFSDVGLKNARGEAWFFAASIDGVLMYYLLDQEGCPLENVRTAVLERYRKLMESAKKGGKG
jgi:AcrR family transcriptional regulator